MDVQLAKISGGISLVPSDTRLVNSTVEDQRKKKRVLEYLITDLDSIFRTMFLEVVEFHDFRHDETFLEVGVNFSSRLRSFGVFLKKKKITHTYQCTKKKVIEE